MKQYVNQIRDSLDGKNVEAVLTEFGTRFHRTIYEHLQGFQFSSDGKEIGYGWNYQTTLTFSFFIYRRNGGHL